MANHEQLALLKIDLQITTDQMNEYFLGLLDTAGQFIRCEGITLCDNVGDWQLQVMYAAYLYRKRKEENPLMPRYLRYALNNRLFSQKMSGGTV